MGITTSSLTHRSPASEKREGQSLGGPVISSFDTYTTHWLADDAPAEMRTKARAFCLRIIKEFYDIGYTPAWHADLDSMSGAKSRNWFSTERGGGFLLVRDGRGAIAGAGGLYGLINKPLTADRLRDRYRDRSSISGSSGPWKRARDGNGRGFGNRGAKPGLCHIISSCRGTDAQHTQLLEKPGLPRVRSLFLPLPKRHRYQR